MKNIILFTICVLNLSVAQAQFSITTYNSTTVGLPSNYLGSVTIDRHNIAWFGGTEYAEGEGGIFRYDGIDWTFTELEEDTSKPGINHIFDIQFGPDENMWVYSYGQKSRITRVDSNSQTDYTPGHIFGSEGYAYDRSIWFIDWWTGLYEYNYDSLKWIFHNNLPVDPEWGPITAFEVDPAGIFWVGIGNKNMYRYKDTVISKIELFPEYPPEYKLYYSINDVAFAPDGSVWLATSEGLVHWFDDDDFIFYNMQNSNLPSNYILDVLIDQRGYIWFNISQNGLGLLTVLDQDFVLYNEDNSALGVNEIRDIAEDLDGNIWAATWGGGASKVHLSPSSVRPSQPSIPSLTIFPNPAETNGELVIFHELSQDLVDVSVWSTDGILLKQFGLQNSQKQNSFELKGMPSGCFIVIAKDLVGNMFTGGFVVTE